MKAVRLLTLQLKMAALLSLQYRLDFLLGSLMSIFWTVTAVVPLFVLFHMRSSVAGWSWSESLIVIGFFTTQKGLMAGLMQPSMSSVVEHIRKGTLDFLLLKPADAQLLVSTSKLDVSKISDVVFGFALSLYGAVTAGTQLTVAAIALASLLLLAGATILYSIWVVAVSLAFHVVKVDNLSYLIVSTFDAARWPSSVFRGALSFLFTFIIPLALMTTYPALALLHRIGAREVTISLGAALAFLALSRWFWNHSITKYTSAGG